MPDSSYSDLSLAVNKLSTAVGNFALATGELVRAIIRATIDVLPFAIEAIVTNYESIAYTWAERYHPEWMKIFRRTKKKRIRKKYHDRIMRSFREAVANGR